MREILATKVLVFTISIIIGPLAVALSVELFTKGKVTGDISCGSGIYSRGRTHCFRNCDQNSSDGTGNYISSTLGRTIETQTKVYEDGAVTVDTAISVKACDESGFFCGKAALSKELTNNFDMKKDTVPYTMSYINRFKSSGLNPKYSSSLAGINGQSASLRPSLGQTRPATSIIDTITFPSTTQSQNKDTKKLGKQIYNQVKAVDPILIAASKISRP